jgi:hypothetical protein
VDIIYAYVPNPVGWVDPLELVKKKPSKYALKDSHNATAQEVADSKLGGGSRSGQFKVRQKLLDEDDFIKKDLATDDFLLLEIRINLISM